jgi:hypothetical protein
MKPFMTTKKKLIEIGVLLAFDIVFYFLWSDMDAVVLFSMGYVWNWVASQDISLLIENKRYRFSMLKMVNNLQNLVVKPFLKFPFWVHSLVRVFPAGLFWWMVIYFNDSIMPWWMTFVGSFTYEVVRLESLLFKKKDPVL